MVEFAPFISCNEYIITKGEIMFQFNRWPGRLILFAIVTLLFTACNSSNSAVGTLVPPTATVSISGVGADGPIAGGTVTVTDATGIMVATGTTNNDGTYNVNVPKTAAIPLDITISGGIDTITNLPQDFPVSTIVTSPVNAITQLNANANAFTTVIVAAAKAEAAATGQPLTTASVAASTTKVVSNLGFGLDPAIDPMNTKVNITNSADLTKANEALSELIRRTTTDKVATDNVANAAAGQATGTVVVANVASLADMQAVIASLAADVSDGVLDGYTQNQAVLDAATKSVNDSYANGSAGQASVAAVKAGKTTAQANQDATTAKQQAVAKAIISPTTAEAQGTTIMAQINTVQVVTEVLTNTLQVTDTSGKVVADAATVQVNMDKYAAASAGLVAGSAQANSVSTAKVDASKSAVFLKKQIAVAVDTSKAIIINNDAYSASNNIATSATQNQQLDALLLSAAVMIDSSVQKAAGTATQAQVDAYSASLSAQNSATNSTMTATKIDATTTVATQVTAVKVTQQLAAKGQATTGAAAQQATQQAQTAAVIQVATTTAKDIYSQQTVQQVTQQSVAVQVQQISQARQQGATAAQVDVYATAAKTTATNTATTATTQAQQASTTVSNVNVNTQNATALTQVTQAATSSVAAAITQANTTAQANTAATPPQFMAWQWANQAQEYAKYTINDVTWNGRLFVAVADQGLIRTSPDGITWTMQASGTSENLNAIAADPVSGKIIVAANNGTLLTSTDGITWSTKKLNVFGDFVVTHWNGTAFFAGEDSGTLFSSVDAVAWTVANNTVVLNTSNGYYQRPSIATANGKSAMLQPRSYYTPLYTTLDNGVTWTPQASPVPGLMSITSTGTQFVGVGRQGVIATSQDAYTWTLQASPVSNTLRRVSWDGSRLLAVGDGGVMLSSIDSGVTWQSTGATDNQLTSIAGNGTIQVAVGVNGTIVSDGAAVGAVSVVQTSRNASPYFTDLIWTGARFVGLSYQGKVYSSIDGYTWNRRVTGNSNYLRALSWGQYGLLAVGDGGVVAKSPDGISWANVATGIAPSISYVKKVTASLQTAQLSRQPNLFDVTQSGGQIVIVGEEGTIITSLDGVTWTKQNSGLTVSYPTGDPTVIPPLTGVAVMGGSMVAVSDRYAVSLVSTDGVNWSPYSTPQSVSLNSIASSNNAFVATDRGITWYSTNGYAWLPTNRTAVYQTRVVWDGLQFITSGTDSYTSTDGQSWTGLSAAQGFQTIAHNGQYWVASKGTQILSSQTGVSWASTNVEDPSWSYAIATDGYTIVSVGRSPSGSASIRYSKDAGVSWNNAVGLPSGSGLTQVIWGGGKFIATGYGILMSSLDGINWQREQGLKYVNPLSLTWTGTHYIIASGNGAYISTNGVTWAYQNIVTPGATEYETVNTVAVNGTTWLAAVKGNDSRGYYNTYLRFYRSNDNGVTWTSIAKIDGNNNYIIDMFWTGAYYIASDGVALYRSLDGINWMSLTLPAVKNGWWYNSFYAIAHDGAGNLLGSDMIGNAWVSKDHGGSWTKQNQILAKGGVYSLILNQTNGSYIALNYLGQVAVSNGTQTATTLVPTTKSGFTAANAYVFNPPAPKPTPPAVYASAVKQKMVDVNLGVQDYYADGSAKPLQSVPITGSGAITIDLPVLNAANATNLATGVATGKAPVIQVPFATLPDASSGRIRVQAIVKDGTQLARAAGERWMGFQYEMDWVVSGGKLVMTPSGDSTIEFSLFADAAGVVSKFIEPASTVDIFSWNQASKTMNVAIAGSMFGIANATFPLTTISTTGNYFYEVKVMSAAKAGGTYYNMLPLADVNGSYFHTINGTFTVQ